jgi:putative spermidine/putrescine transport system substrate-binding protein
MITRRKFIKATIAGATYATFGSVAFPNILKGKKRKLRVLGTHVTLQEAIRKKAEADLGLEIEFSPGGSAEVIHKATTRPDSFDIYEQWSNSLKVLWNADAIQGIEIDRIQYWTEINDLTKKGKITPEANIGAGDAPYKLLYVQDSKQLGSEKSNYASFLPYVHNTDSFGYNSAIIPEGIPYETESWGWLLNEKYHGKVALVNEPTIGLFDAALAVQANGLMQFQDIGNMTKKEIDIWADENLGIQLDRRNTKDRMIADLKPHL